MKWGAVLVAAVFMTSLLAGPARAKGEGVGLWMEGTISNVRVAGEKVHLVLTGRFWFEQFHGPARSIVEVDGRRGIPVTVAQARPFFAMTSDWKGGAIREKEVLPAILKAAARLKRTVKLELTDAWLVFGQGLEFEVADGLVIRATDADLH